MVEMRSLVLFPLLWMAGVGPLAAEPAKPIGTILEATDSTDVVMQIRVKCDYAKDGRLTLTLDGIEMNAAAKYAPDKAVGGVISVKDGEIRITPKEIYDDRGAVESLRVYAVRYVIPKVPAGSYRLVHDDSNTEGTDRVVDLKLDLTKPGTKELVADFSEKKK